MSRSVLWLSLSQFIAWGVSYYLVGVFGETIAADLGWSRAIVHGGFSVALLTMALLSPFVGQAIDRRGGRWMMAGGAVLNAAGCLGLAAADTMAAHYAAWICLGAGMRLTLYDAAFATLARLEGPHAGRSMSQITLLGGLASTAFWPFGQWLAESFGWRGALFVYSLCSLATIPLHLALPDGRYDTLLAGAPPARGAPSAHGGAGTPPRGAPSAHERSGVLSAHYPAGAPPAHVLRRRWRAAGLYAVIIALTNILNSAMSAHMIDILGGLGVAAAASVWISSLRGVGQSLARLGEIAFGRRVDPSRLNLGATAVLPCAFVAGLLSGGSLAAAAAFAFLFGAGNGIVTITRGTLPIVLFDHRDYGAFTGRLLAPSFVLSAAAPLVYAFVIERAGAGAALYLSTAIALAALAASALLVRVVTRERRRRESDASRTHPPVPAPGA